MYTRLSFLHILHEVVGSLLIPILPCLIKHTALNLHWNPYFAIVELTDY